MTPPAAAILAAVTGLDSATRHRLERDVAAGRAAVTVGTHRSAPAPGSGGGKPVDRAAVRAAVLAAAAEVRRDGAAYQRAAEARAAAMLEWVRREQLKG